MITKVTPVYEVLYVSTMTPTSPVSIVKDIAVGARAFNLSHDITGLLIFDGLHFCQQLEGEKKVVLKLIEKICSDARHTNVEVIHNAPLADRRFNRFSLGYATFDDINVLAELKKLDGQPAVDAFLALLTTLDMEA